MRDLMADDFLSYMVYFFKALFLITLKFQLCHGIKSKLFIIYVVMGLRVAILRFSCVSSFFMSQTLKIQKNGKKCCKKISFFHEKNT